jgi:hypothetical protein
MLSYLTHAKRKINYFVFIARLRRHVIFTMLLAFFARNIAEGDTDQNDNQNSHTNADPHNFLVDTLVRPSCGRVKKKITI